MSTFYQQTAVLRFLKIAELWGKESNTDMWTMARLMASGTKPKLNEWPLIISHCSSLLYEGHNTGGGNIRNCHTFEALEILINEAPDHPIGKIVSGLHDICISRENFRKWCIEKYPLPKFWFEAIERTTFSEEEKVQIERVGKLTLAAIKKGNDRKIETAIFELKPSIWGFGINLRELYKYLKNKIKT